MKATLLLATLVLLLKEASCFPVVTADVTGGCYKKAIKRKRAGEEINTRKWRNNWRVDLWDKLWRYTLLARWTAMAAVVESNSCTFFIRVASRDEQLAGGNGHCSQQSSWGAAEDWSGVGALQHPSSSPDTMRDSPDHKPQRAVMKVGEKGWYSQLMWPNARVPYVLARWVFE